VIAVIVELPPSNCNAAALSTAVIAGIVVGTVVGGLLVALVVVLVTRVCIRKRDRDANAQLRQRGLSSVVKATPVD
jgi:Ca2+/Na+ antiporter